MRISIGKARVVVAVEGCIGCGTSWSSGWTKVREVSVMIGGRQGAIDLSLCADCQAAAEERGRRVREKLAMTEEVEG